MQRLTEFAQKIMLLEIKLFLSLSFHFKHNKRISSNEISNSTQKQKFVLK